MVEGGEGEEEGRRRRREGKVDVSFEMDAREKVSLFFFDKISRE